jgi:pyruvate dehydrogenase E2 component (dihydrolipoamide acetyltransferase)
MAELINMPKLGFDMREGQLINWVKAVGDTVERGDVLAEIESDKATVEVEAYTSGTLLELLAEEGDWVPIGAPIAVIGAEGEDYNLAALGVEGEGEAEAQPEAEAEVAEAPAKEEKQPEVIKGGNGHGLPGGVRASPLARRVAEDLGIDLGRVEGSGPQGRIVKADVEEFAEGGEAAKAAPAGMPQAAAAYEPVEAGPDDTEFETPRMRQRIGQRMVQAKQQVPHFYVTTEIDMDAAMQLRKGVNERLADQDIKVSLNDLIVKAAALTLREYPNLNASFNGDTIIQHGHINIGIAVAVENGLINVVSKDADEATLSALAVRHKELIGRARSGKIKPGDVEGETFAVSNLGPWDVDHFIAIINPPSAAILALGTAARQPVVKDDGTLGVGYRMKATVSADHRVTDGAEAAAFLQAFKQVLEDPIRLLV